MGFSRNSPQISAHYQLSPKQNIGWQARNSRKDQAHLHHIGCPLEPSNKPLRRAAGDETLDRPCRRRTLAGKDVALRALGAAGHPRHLLPPRPQHHFPWAPVLFPRIFGPVLDLGCWFAGTTADDLYPLFDKYGKVVDVFIPKDRRFVLRFELFFRVFRVRVWWVWRIGRFGVCRFVVWWWGWCCLCRTGDSRGFAFVRYKYADEAQKAVEKLDGDVSTLRFMGKKNGVVFIFVMLACLLALGWWIVGFFFFCFCFRKGCWWAWDYGSVCEVWSECGAYVSSLFVIACFRWRKCDLKKLFRYSNCCHLYLFVYFWRNLSADKHACTFYHWL